MQFAEVQFDISPENKIDEQIQKSITKMGDIFIYSGDISPVLDKALVDFIEEHKTTDNLNLFLSTYGGDADSAFKSVRYLKQIYKQFTLIVVGECKSAGTILALGADRIIMGSKGEFGPLDVQVFKPDEFLKRSSGLTITQALEYIGDQAFELFEDMFLKIRAKSAGNITTKTAAEISSMLVVGLYSPITEKIDPAVIGEMQRSMEIAIQYGLRLGVDYETVSKLTKSYPSHSFVIDYNEAKKYFPNVNVPSDYEQFLIDQLRAILISEFDYDILMYPSEEEIALKVSISSLNPKSETKKRKIKNESELQNQNGK